jgi:CheY-like chemotaxis protein
METTPFPPFRVLCVEEDIHFQRTLKIALGNYGIDVVTASDGIDGLTQYRAHEGEFDAILSDNEMLQMNGSTFIREVREMGYQGRIVLMSGNLRPEQFQDYALLGISGFFQKPFEISLLANMLLLSES